MGLGAAALLPQHGVEASLARPRYMLVGNKEGVSIHKLPQEDSVIMYQRAYNDIISVYDEVVGPDGPSWNPIWYRCWGGYVYSGYLYEVKYELNSLGKPNRPTGQLAEVTVPYTRSLLWGKQLGWIPEYRLYYRSTHWVMDVIEGPDKKPWYKIKDELIEVELAVPTEHLRLIPDTELSPISPDVPASEKRINVSLSQQHLEAFEGDNRVFETKISTGGPTPEGVWNIQTKMPSKHMGNANLTSDIYSREWMGVPWNAFFELTEGMATHGTFWHSNFGTMMSGGCINMRMDDAKWLYLWSTPVCQPDAWTTTGYGTPIHITR